MAFSPEIDLVAVLVAAAAYFVVGFLWYTPLFGKLWMKEMGIPAGGKPTAKQMAPALINNAIGCLLLAFVFAWIMAASGAAELASESGTHTADAINAALGTVTMGQALEGAGWAWLGFFLPVDASRAAWENKSWTLVAINAGYHLVGLAVIAVVIAALA